MKKSFLLFTIFLFFILSCEINIGTNSTSNGIGTIIDHNDIIITSLNQNDLNLVKQRLHIMYGHTSHGSQITSGMRGLVSFANNGGKGLNIPENIFSFNNGGTDGALDLREGDGYGDGDMDHDAGYYPNWVNETREYLGITNSNGKGSNNPDINVIIWAWCGQVSGKTEESMVSEYLAPMSQLESDYPGVVFVYMTGHAEGSGESGNLHLRNRQIRDYCEANNKFLYDFYDIECYDPDGNYYGDRNVSDTCSYDGGNWATEWQNAHTQDVDWYQCDSAHSEPLNANMKAFAAWNLWVAISRSIN